MNFQTIVVIVLILILIVCLTVIGMTLHKGSTAAGQRIVPACPDYWTIDGSSNMCVNVRNLGTCPPEPGHKFLTMDFNQAPYVGSDAACQKYTWANKCGVSWEGITYGVSKSPCETTTDTFTTADSSTSAAPVPQSTSPTYWM